MECDFSRTLTQENALAFRICHIGNIEWLLTCGLCCSNSETKSVNWVSIGNQELIEKRRGYTVGEYPYGTLNDYIPFYFTPFTPMAYNIHTGYDGIKQCDNKNIIIFIIKLKDIKKANIPFVFTDMHAASHDVSYYNDLNDLHEIDWKILQQRDFTRPDETRVREQVKDRYPELSGEVKEDIVKWRMDKVLRYQAEVLIRGHLPIELIDKIICYNIDAKEKVMAAIAAVEASTGRDLNNIRNKIEIQSGWYFR